MSKYLLSDEKNISEENQEERIKIIENFKEMPEEFFSRLRHLQPQIGCLNACSICSKFSSTTIQWWNEDRIRNVIAALKYCAKKFRDEKPYIVWDRKQHRNEVIFSYSDNDIGNYYYLDKFIELAYKELGVKTRISTVGYSRFNEKLNKMHSNIAKNHQSLGGVRLSFTPYAIGWCSSNREKFSKEDYMKDVENFLKIYHPYYEQEGSGCRKMCVELRYKPLVGIKKVEIGTVDDYTYIYTNKYLYISKDKNINFNIAYIKDPLDHSIKLSEDPIKFNYIYLEKDTENIETYIKDNIKLNDSYKIVDVYMMQNEDGIYYAIEPSIKKDGNYGINIYPKTAKRPMSGYLITERFLVNAMISYKSKFNISKSEKFPNATWDDVDNVIKSLYNMAKNYYDDSNMDKSIYIRNHIIPMIEPYADALRNAGYEANCFFDPSFTIDTGIICNMGRAKAEFKGLTSKINNPMTPTHERNYGKTNSTMIVENHAWKLNCGYDNTLIIEKLNLCNTATEEGQIVYSKTIKLSELDDKKTTNNLNDEYLIPGQREFM